MRLPRALGFWVLVLGGLAPWVIGGVVGAVLLVRGCM